VKISSNSEFQEEPPSPSLILKSTMQFDHPRFGRVTIEFHPEGLPARHAITHGSRCATGSHPSVKMGRTMVWSSFGERTLIRHLDYQFDCQGFLVQPCVIKWEASGIPHIYFPDAIAEIDHRITVLESKNVHPNVHGAHKGEKYRMAEDICRWIGWDFQILTNGTLTDNPDQLLNHQDLFRNQSVRFELAHELIVRDALTSAGGLMLFGGLEEALARAMNIKPVAAQAIILAMAVRRLVRFNLEKRINPVSPVHLVAPRAAGMKILNFWENANDEA
jgi:hypothetical protein